MPASTLGTGYAWVGETESRPETTVPGFKMVTIPTNEVYAMPSITQQLLDNNAFNLETWLVEELGDAFGDGEGDAFINGNGGVIKNSTVKTRAFRASRSDRLLSVKAFNDLCWSMAGVSLDEFTTTLQS